MQVALDVFHHDDGVVDHEAYRQYHGQKGEEIDREAEERHQEDRADQRDRDGYHGDDHGTDRS